MRKILPCVLLCALTFSASAQLPVFTKTSSTYSNLIGATRVMKDSVWDNVANWKPAERQINLGFTFKAFDNQITKFEWADGAITFRIGDTVINIGLGDGADFCDRGFGSKDAKSPLSKKLEGTAGNYIMKLEWRNFRTWDGWNTNPGASDSGNMQLWIYQNPNKVELRFGLSKWNDFNLAFPDKIPVAVAKYDQNGNTSGIVLNGNPSSPTTHSFGDTGTRRLNAWPVNGTIYVFTFDQTAAVPKINREVNSYFDGNNIHLPRNETSEVQVFSATGKLLLKGIAKGEIYSVENFQPGVYFAKITQGIHTATLKFMVAAN